MPDSPHTADIVELNADRERDYTEILTQIGAIAMNVIDDNENVPIHLVAMAIACRMVERFPDIELTPDPEAAATIERLNDWLVETQMRAHKWMEAHDKLKMGRPYDLPGPADLPDALTEVAAEIKALREAGQRVLDGLNARIDAAPGDCVPLFDGIAELHAALAKAKP